MKKLLIMFLSAIITLSVYAQETSVKGVVTSADDGLPLPGVTVVVKGTMNGTVTNVDGYYELKVTDDAVISYSFVGMKIQDVTIEGRSEINVALETDAYGIDEVIAIGYGSVKKSDVTGSVVAVNVEQMASKNATNLSEGLQGMAAGVQVLRTSGKPGASANVVIRGVATINNSTKPLYVVDGIMVGTDANFLNPNDIASIEILKDASATAIYGSRGANGVIMIATKGGEAGKSTLNVKVDFGFQTPGNQIEVANMAGFTKVANQVGINDGKAPNPDWADPSKLNYIDWQDEMTESSLRQQYYISSTGGSEDLKASFSIGYLKDKGVIRATEFKRLTARTKVEYNISDFIKTGLNMAYTREDGHGGGNLYNYAVTLPTMDHNDGSGLMHVPVQYPDGTWGTYQKDETSVYIGKGQDNPVAQAETAENPWFNNRIIANAFIEIELAKGLTFKSVNGLNYSGNGGHYYAARHLRTANAEGIDRFGLNNSSSLEYLTENYFTYNNTFGAHRINAMAGFSANKRKSQRVSATAQDFPTSNIRNIDLTQDAASISGAGLLGLESRQESYFARLNYTAFDRYILTATVRRDGSSNFGPENKYGTFPSASLAWRISEESFMQDVDAISNLKLRLGWGQTGNAGYATNRYADQLSSEKVRYFFYDYENPDTYMVAPGLAQAIEVDQNLKWETNEQINVGLDFSIMDNSLMFTLDWFQRDAKDLLLYKKIRPSTGFENVYTNAGHIQNKGIELSATYQKSFGDWSINAQLNGSHINSKTIDIGDDIFYEEGIQTGLHWENYSITRNGYPVGSYFGYTTDGIFQNQSEIDALNATAPEGVYQTAVQPGDYKYVDINGDKKIDSDDRDVIGDGYASLVYGFNLNVGYKNFDFSMNANGVVGQDILSYAYMNLGSAKSPTGGMRNVSQEYADGFWNGEGTSNEFVRPTQLDANHNTQVSDAFILKGDFFKIQNMQIGYTFSSNTLENVKVSSARVYLSMNNVATFSSYKNVGDPEVGNTDPRQTGFDGGRYPFPRIYTLGLSIGF